MDYTGIASALATRYAGTPTPAGGYRALRGASYTPAEDVPPLPWVLVFPPTTGSFDTGNGTRTGSHEWIVRLLYDEAGDLARQTAALLAWAETFADRLKGSVQLGGIVARATLDSYSIGFFGYADKMYAGIEGRVRIITSEPWAAVA
jgi:hypothetical protein